MCVPVGIAIAGSALLGLGTSIVQGNLQAAAQDRQLAQAKENSDALLAEQKKIAAQQANANPTQDTSAAVTLQNQRDALSRLRQGLSSTVLTSPLGATNSAKPSSTGASTGPATPSSTPLTPNSMATALRARLGE